MNSENTVVFSNAKVSHHVYCNFHFHVCVQNESYSPQKKDEWGMPTLRQSCFSHDGFPTEYVNNCKE